MMEYNFGDYVIFLLAFFAVFSLPVYFLYCISTLDFTALYDYFINLNAGMPK